jgi:hypothetical protein
VKSYRTFTWFDFIVLVLSGACIGAAAISTNHALDIVAGLPLTIYLPGAALVSIFGPNRRINTVERQVWSVGASFGLNVAGGLVLNLAGGLTRSSWLVWVGAVIGICLIIKLLLAPFTSRSKPSPPERIVNVGVIPESDETLVVGKSDSAKGHGAMRVAVRQVVLLLTAGAISVAAMVLSIHTNTATTRESFVQAWVIPRPSEDVTSTSVELGLRNDLGGERTFEVDVTVGSGRAEEIEIFSVPLTDGEAWTKVITRKPGERVESVVYNSSKPNVALTRVYLVTPIR